MSAINTIQNTQSSEVVPTNEQLDQIILEQKQKQAALAAALAEKKQAIKDEYEKKMAAVNIERDQKLAEIEAEFENSAECKKYREAVKTKDARIAAANVELIRIKQEIKDVKVSKKQDEKEIKVALKAAQTQSKTDYKNSVKAMKKEMLKMINNLTKPVKVPKAPKAEKVAKAPKAPKAPKAEKVAKAPKPKIVQEETPVVKKVVKPQFEQTQTRIPLNTPKPRQVEEIKPIEAQIESDHEEEAVVVIKPTAEVFEPVTETVVESVNDFEDEDFETAAIVQNTPQLATPDHEVDFDEDLSHGEYICEEDADDIDF